LANFIAESNDSSGLPNLGFLQLYTLSMKGLPQIHNHFVKLIQGGHKVTLDNEKDLQCLIIDIQNLNGI